MNKKDEEKAKIMLETENKMRKLFNESGLNLTEIAALLGIQLAFVLSESKGRSPIITFMFNLVSEYQEISPNDLKIKRIDFNLDK